MSLPEENIYFNPEELEKKFEKLVEEEHEIEIQLDAAINEIKALGDNLIDMTIVNENINAVRNDLDNISCILNNSSKLSDKINLQIQELDIARSRVSECQKRVQDLLDLQLCSDGVQNALKDENYEQAAVHVHRFLTMDQHLLKQTADDMAQDCAAITQSLKLLRDAASVLSNKISLHFKEAISVKDIDSVKRFFKLFPLLDMRNYGLENFSTFLRRALKDTINDKLVNIKTLSIKDKRNSVIFADIITFLFEEIAQLTTTYQPLIETYYGSGSLIQIITPFQKECDLLCSMILNEFRNQREFNSKVVIINELLRSNSSKVEHIDPKDIDLLLNEITMIHSRFELYLRFLRFLINQDVPPEISENQKYELIIRDLDNLIKNSDLCKQMQILISDYLLLERYYMEQSIKKAITMDSYDKESLTSSVVDDIFFIIKKCIRRGYSSDNNDAVCAIINNACAILETEVCNHLRQQLRQGYSVGYLDLTQAYNVIHGRLQQVDSEQTRISFLIYLNNSDICGEYTNTLLSTLTDELKCSSKNEQAKLESCLHELNAVISAFSKVKDYGFQQIRSSVVKPRIVPWVDNFLSVSHQLSLEEFSSYDANEPFIRSLIMNLDSLISEFKPRLTAVNYDLFVAVIADEVILQLEKVILKTDFNRVGGLALDKEIRTLISYMSNTTSWFIREKFTRLTQIALILNLEKVTEISEYWGVENCTFTWRLTLKEIKQFLSLRKDFRAEDIKRLKL